MTAASAVGQDVTSDKYITNRSNKVVIDALGITHASVIVEEIPLGVAYTGPPPPFAVRMCDLLDAYDEATGWYDFVYPSWFASVEQEHEGHPTCVRCAGA